MVLAGNNLSRLLETSGQRVRVSRDLSERSSKFIQTTRQAISISRGLIAQSDETIHQMLTAPHRTGQAELPAQTAHPAQAEPAAQAAEAQQPPTGRFGRPPAMDDLLEIVSGRTHDNQLVPMDSRHFIDCAFTDCTLEYSGLPLLIESTSFSGCNFSFAGEAALTMRFLECFGILHDNVFDYRLSGRNTKRQTLPF